jgi:hypothetical protein
MLMEYCRDNGTKKAPQPPYSLDPASFDFYLLVHVKRCLSGCLLADADQLLQTILALLNGIEQATIQAVFLEWMERLRKSTQVNRDYIK